MMQKLASAAAAGVTLGALALATPASATNGVLPPNKLCPNFLSEWTFYAGVYSDVAYNLTINSEIDRQCGYIAETRVTSGNGSATEVWHNFRVTITKGFIYPIVIL